MPKRPDPTLVDDDNPELTSDQIRTMRPASEVLPPALYASLVANYEARQAAKRREHLSGAPRPDGRDNVDGGELERMRGDEFDEPSLAALPTSGRG